MAGQSKIVSDVTQDPTVPPGGELPGIVTITFSSEPPAKRLPAIEPPPSKLIVAAPVNVELNVSTQLLIELL
jgi:hypothetical protein